MDIWILAGLVYVFLALVLLGMFIAALVYVLVVFLKKKSSPQQTVKARFAKALPGIVVLLAVMYMSDGPITAGCRQQYKDTATYSFARQYCRAKELVSISTPLSDNQWRYSGFFK